MHDLLLGGGLELDVDETRPGNVNRFHPSLKNFSSQQTKPQGLSQLPGILFEWFRQLHGGRSGQVTMGGNFGRLEHGPATCPRGEFFQLKAKRLKQFNFY